jgi:hypothetical protein
LSFKLYTLTTYVFENIRKGEKRNKQIDQISSLLMLQSVPQLRLVKLRLKVLFNQQVDHQNQNLGLRSTYPLFKHLWNKSCLTSVRIVIKLLAFVVTILLISLVGTDLHFQLFSFLKTRFSALLINSRISIIQLDVCQITVILKVVAITVAIKKRTVNALLRCQYTIRGRNMGQSV